VPVDLPEGPVTIMFTDVEGSTALRTSLGDAEADALFNRHNEIVRAQIEAHRGRDQQAALGDGFLAVFASTRRALACAVAVQRALDAFNRSRTAGPLRVRIGLHTGEVAWQGDQLSGEAVHAAARVCAAAEGGQILVSDVTRQLAGTMPDLSFHDAGERDLKGFPQPWRLWEVVWVRETGRVPEQVFVGREDEMARLRQRLDAAMEGRGSLVLLGGEPGVGKTTIVRQLIREAERRGALALFGRCYESEGTVPYSPFIEMLEQALSLIPPEIVREDMGEDAGEVARMVPEIRRRFPDIPDPLDLPPEQQRRYFFHAVGAFVSRGAGRFPLVLVLDDVHWADEPTLLLIEHMARLMPDIRVLGVGTYRDVELDVARPLAASLERLVRARLVERLAVRRFDRDGVARMLEALAGRTPPDALVDAIYDESEGNPFFVEEVFRHLVEEGRVYDDRGEFRTDLRVDELDVPESVRLVVGRRLERLGTEARRALAAGAVVGRGFSSSLLEAITDLDPGRLLDAVEEAEAARVIVPEERGGEVHYTFAHELIRQTLLAGMSVLRRQRLHLAVADALERLDPDGARERRPSEIAGHLLQAGAAADPARTLEYLDRAAARAMEAAAFEEALRHSETALALDDGADPARRAALEERLGWAHRALGSFDRALEVFARVVDAYEDLGEAEEAARLLREIAYQNLWLGRFDAVFAANARGLQILGDRRSPARVYLEAGLGALAGVGGLTDAGLESIDRAEALASELSDDRAIGWASWTRCVTVYSAALPAASVEPGLKAVEHLRRAQDLWTLCDALCWTALSYVLSGELDRGLALATEGLDLSRRLGHRGAEILSWRCCLGANAARSGDLAGWERDARHDLELCREIGSPWVSQSHTWLGAIAQLAGRIEEGARHIEEAIPLEPPSAYQGLGKAYLVLNRAWGGDASRFRAELAEAREALEGAGATRRWATKILAVNAAQGAAILGLPDVAAGLYEPLLVASRDVRMGFFDAVVTTRICGMTAALLERWDEAEAHFAEAWDAVRRMGHALEAPQLSHWHGKMLIDSGRDPARGRVMVAEAIEGYRRMGMPVLLARAEQALSR
jgi:class 3 adenylate cyclase/tetratricopeptide (TPR) repeat protein